MHFTLIAYLNQMSQISNAQQITLGYWLLHSIGRIREVKENKVRKRSRNQVINFRAV